jgi:drug/metabolite transporter (DMT)-like permease
MNKTLNSAHLSALAAMFLWGISYIWMKQLFDYLEPASILFFRLVVSSVFLYFVLRLMGKLERIKKEHYALFLLSALLNPFLYFMGESHGLQLVSPTISAVIIATIPVFTPVFARFFLKEHLSKLNIAGLIISFAGVLMMLVMKDFSLSADPFGVLYLFGAVASAIVYGIILKKLTLLYNALTIVWIQNFIGLFYFIPVILYKETDTLLYMPFSSQVILPILLLGVFSSSLAFVFFTRSVRSLGIARTNIYTNMIPVFTVMFSYFLLGELQNGQQFFGMMLVISGVIISQTKKRKVFQEA